MDSILPFLGKVNIFLGGRGIFLIKILLPNRKIGSNRCHVLRLPPLAAAGKTACIKCVISEFFMRKSYPRAAGARGRQDHSRNNAGSMVSPFLATEKCRWAPSPASERLVFPTVPMTAPALTLSPARTGGSGWRLA